MNPISRSLAQQEEYRVRDTDGPQTEQEMPPKFDLYVYEVDGHDDLVELGDVLRKWARPRGRRFSLMRSIPRAEAALLARPVEPDPQTEGRKHCVYRGCVRRDGHEGEHHVTAQTLEAIEHAGYERGLLARRAPGDRERENRRLREALAALIPLVPVPGPVTRSMGRPHIKREYDKRVAALADARDLLAAALAADSRPEQPAPSIHSHPPTVLREHAASVRPEEPPE